ncbi:hypothetical protein EMIT0158MI4_40562 [Burkholderia ambifaria]
MNATPYLPHSADAKMPYRAPMLVVQEMPSFFSRLV